MHRDMLKKEENSLVAAEIAEFREDRNGYDFCSASDPGLDRLVTERSSAKDEVSFTYARVRMWRIGRWTNRNRDLFANSCVRTDVTCIHVRMSAFPKRSRFLLDQRPMRHIRMRACVH